MSANLKIREKPGELVVRVTEIRDIKSILMNVSAGGVVALLFFHAFSGSTRVVAVGVTAVIIGMKIISAFGGADVELRVDNLDFVSTGHSPSDYQPSTIARADVSGLEFREANGGGAEFPDLPQGLYIEHNGPAPWSSATCVLPHANRVQTNEVIEAILRLFPDTGLDYHLKTGHTLSLQNRPTEVAEDVIVLPCRSVRLQGLGLSPRSGVCYCGFTLPGSRLSE